MRSWSYRVSCSRELYVKTLNAKGNNYMMITTPCCIFFINIHCWAIRAIFLCSYLNKTAFYLVNLKVTNILFKKINPFAVTFIFNGIRW